MGVLGQDGSELIVQLSSRRLNRNCPFEFRGGGVAVTSEAQNADERAVRFRIIGSNSHCLACLGFRLVQLASLGERVREIDVRLRKVGFQTQGSTKLRDRLLYLTLSQKHPAKGVMRFRAVGRKLSYCFKGGAGTREVS